MNILSINNQGKGDGVGKGNKKDATFFYRWVVPAKYLRRMGDKCYQLPLKKDADFDIVIFNKFFGVDTSGTIENIRRVYPKVKIVYETDDLQWNPDKNLTFYSDLKKMGLLETVSTFSQMLAQQADACTCTTEQLKLELKKVTNKPVYVTPNSVDLEDWKPRKGGNERLKIGFVGAPNHWPHMKMLLKAVKRLKKFYDFDFIMKGTYLTGSILTARDEKSTGTQYYQALLDCYKEAKNMEILEKNWSSNEDFAKDVSDLNLDIGICILDDTVFNQCRSALKFYQYAACKTATIASNTIVYRDECNYTVNNDEESWYKGLQKLIVDKELRDKITEEQYEWVKASRSAEVIAHTWQDTFKSIVSKPNDTI